MFKKAAKSIGAALMYFGIYLAWQIIVVFWAMFGIMMVMSFSAGADMGNEMVQSGVEYSYEEIMSISQEREAEIAIEASEIILDYAVHLTALAGILTIITYIVMFKIRKKNFFEQVGLRRISPLICGVMLLLGAALNFATVFILSIIPFPKQWWDEYSAQASAMVEADLWATVLLSVIIAPVLEEIVFRGLVHTRLKKCIPMLAAMIISAWLFGVMHGAMIWFIYASVFGFILAWVYEKYKSLLAPIMLHFGFNLCGTLVSEVENVPAIVCIIAVLLSACGIAFVQLTSKNKIEFLPVKAEKTSSDTGASE